MLLYVLYYWVYLYSYWYILLLNHGSIVICHHVLFIAYMQYIHHGYKQY